MTDEQIIQNAEHHIMELGVQGENRYFEMNGYVAGAHSRDEEIEELENYYHEMFVTLAYKVEQLRNPWISVEERMPEKNCIVFVSLGGTEYLSAHYRVKSKRFVTVSKDKQSLIEVRRSSSTYATSGDCVKEEKLYSEGTREDITNIVTHWMPIPELKET